MFFQYHYSFRHILHFGVGRSQIEWNMKEKGQILICTAIMLNDHSNPYIESTTVLSDNNKINIIINYSYNIFTVRATYMAHVTGKCP